MIGGTVDLRHETISDGFRSSVHRLVAEAVGTSTQVSGVQVLAASASTATLLLTTAPPPSRLVLKLAAMGDAHIDFTRTAAAADMARRAGVAVPAVVAADTTGRSGPWQYLLHEHIGGEPWRTVRPRLDTSQIRSAHRQIAEAVLAIQSVRPARFGDIASESSASSVGIVDALRLRAKSRIGDLAGRELFLAVLDRDAALFSDCREPVLTHDDLHHANLVFAQRQHEVVLAGVLDWDKAWAGPGESDVARMAFWDDMTGPGFWEVYREARPAAEGEEQRMLLYQLLWCLEYDANTTRHRVDTIRVCRLLGDPTRVGGLRPLV
jgi:aminoglycoside phosphotransferase (APT) family kinase protein